VSVIAKDRVAAIHYVLRDDEGEVLDSSEGDEPLTYLHGADNIVTGLEEGLAGKAAGDEVTVVVSPEKGYGPRTTDGPEAWPRKAFPAELDLEEGMELDVQTPDGASRTIHVVGVEGDEVWIDRDHPLAGMTLRFEVKVVSVRDATSAELAHGHPHEGVHGH
jgi:FKBP-type peptidyl-prolyl cis-trans isomerase SlyD